MSSQCEHTDNETDMSMDTNDMPDGRVFDFNRLNYEEERKKSFDTWPVHYPVDPTRLAKAGFYYSGTGDEVVCFSCQGHIKNWNYGDIVLKKHSDLYPDCDFIKNASNNVPFTKSLFESNPPPCNMKKCSDAMQLSNDIDYEKMKSENERMKSFTEKWPLTNVNIADLAHAGYFYTGIGDKVQCAFCKVIVGDLKVSNATPGEYLKHFPWCDHLNDKSSNFIPKAKNKTPWYQTSSQDVCGNMKPIESRSDKTTVTNKLITKNQQVNLEELGVYLHKNPIHPHYASLLARLGTFSSWPLDAPVSKEELAAAGFFHLGTEDRTVCFHCNGGLKKWEEGDDPWIEHARWFSGCDFVRLNKGSDFIITCLLKSTSAILNENRDVISQPDTSESLLKKLDEAMKSNLVRNLAEAGIFPPYILRAAILLQIKHTGSSFSSYDDLCVAASYLKEKMEEQYFNEKPVQAEDLNICLKISKNLTLSDAAEETNQAEQTPSHSIDRSDEKNLNKGESMVTGNVIPTEKPSMQLNENQDHYLCQICMDKELGVVFLPCGHLPACTICAPALKHCPLCRKPIQATVRCFFH